jgi:hypothetical protein
MIRDVVYDALDSFVDTVGPQPAVASTARAAVAHPEAKVVR